MSQEQELDRFIYGKFVGPESGYRIVAHSSNLEDQQALQEIAEQEYRFWENHSHYNLWGVGICRNNTQILPEQEIILIQESLAQGSRKIISGSRSFYQRLYIFVSETTTLELNKSILWWLTKFSREKVPTFTALNQPNDSVDSWDFGQDYFSLTDEQTQKANPEKIITDVWQKLSTNERNLWLQTLDAIMNGKKLLIAIADNNRDAKSKFLPKLDNFLLLFIPIAWRNKLSIAMGKNIDLDVCKWANIVVSFQENAISLPPGWVYLDLASKTITSNQGIESEYVKDFIEPLKDDYKNLITLCQNFAENSNVGLNLKTSNSQSESPNFNYLQVQYQDKSLNVSRSPQDKPLDFSHPSVDFVLDYPKDDAYKTQLFSKYLEPMKSELQTFLRNAGKDKEMELGILWDAIKQNLTTSADIAILCLGKMFALLTKDEFLKRLRELEAAHLMNLISHGLLKELNKEDNLELIKKELQLICLKIIKEERNNYDYEKLKSLVSSDLQEIFASEVEKFKLWDSFLAQKIDEEKFMNLFDDRLIPLMPKINVDTFNNSYLIKYLQNKCPAEAWCLQDVLSNRNLSNLCALPQGLEMNNALTQKLYINFLESESPKYESSHNLLVYAIKKSINPEKIEFEIKYFLEVYQWFNKNKPGLFEILNKLDETNQSWLSWENIATFLYSDNDNQANRVDFLDSTVAQKFPAEVFKTWFNLLKSEPNNPKIKESFLNGKAWQNLSEETLENLYICLTNDFPDYVGKLIEWAYEKGRFDLISGKLTESAVEIWIKNKKIDENTWQILMHPEVQEKLCNEKRFEMRIADLWCEKNSLPLTSNVENKGKNTVKERENKSESQPKKGTDPFKDIANKTPQQNVSTTDYVPTNLASTQMSNKNQNKSQVNESRRELPIYNDEEQETQNSLTKLARQKVNLFKDYPETIESFLQICENFEANILQVLVEVNFKNCPVGLYLNYLRRNNIDKSSQEYFRCLEKLSLIQSNTTEQQQITDFMGGEITDIIKDSNIPELEKQRIKLAVDLIVSQKRQELK